MKFCNVCNNLMRLTKGAADTEVVHQCALCGFVEPVDEIVHMTFEKPDGTLIRLEHLRNNKWLLYDVTLPRVMRHCPSCDAQKLTVAVLYDDEDQRYMYRCTECHTDDVP